MKNLVLILVLIVSYYRTYSQCYIGKKDGWEITDGNNFTTNKGFVIVSHFPEVEFDKGKCSFNKVNKLLEDTIHLQRERSYFYYFDFTTKQLDLHDCNGLLKTYNLSKIKCKGNSYFITINEVGKKIKFKVVFGDYVEFVEISYYKNKKYSEILVNKYSSYYSKK